MKLISMSKIYKSWTYPNGLISEAIDRWLRMNWYHYYTVQVEMHASTKRTRIEVSLPFFVLFTKEIKYAAWLSWEEGVCSRQQTPLHSSGPRTTQ